MMVQREICIKKNRKLSGEHRAFPVEKIRLLHVVSRVIPLIADDMY